MSQSTPLDPSAILASLGIHDATDLQPLRDGADTAMWQVRWNGRQYALRVFRPEQTQVYARELAAMQIAAQGGIPVPEVVRSGSWEDRPVLLLSWIVGETVSKQIQSRPQLVWRLGTVFGRMQAAIHNVSTPAGIDTNRWIEWAGDEPELKTRLYDLPSRKTVLLHLDYHPLNVMASGGQISGVLDWANAAAGDPRADFARTYTILRVEPHAPDGGSLLWNAGRRLFERAWRWGYGRVAGHPDEMALFYAWAGSVMIRDLSPRIGKAGHWLRDEHLGGVRAWRDAWKRRAGIGS